MQLFRKKRKKPKKCYKWAKKSKIFENLGKKCRIFWKRAGDCVQLSHVMNCQNRSWFGYAILLTSGCDMCFCLFVWYKIRLLAKIHLIRHQIWYNHPLSQRNEVAKRVGSGFVGTKFEKGRVGNIKVSSINRGPRNSLSTKQSNNQSYKTI